MRLEFNDEQKNKELHIVHLEEDDVVLVGDYVVKEEEGYAIFGTATIDSERFLDFKVLFELVEEIEEETVENIMMTEWEWYDFDFH
ncbi:MAG: hypothetical protein R3Y53_05635 [Bacillota bacterium]